MNDNLIKVALDVGSSKIRIIVGELSEKGEKIQILTSLEASSKGMVKGQVEDLESLSQFVKQVIEEAEVSTGHKIEKVSIGVSGKHIKSRTKNIKFDFLEGDKVIEEKDLKKLYEIAQNEIMQPQEQLLKKEIYNIRVDNSGILKHPIGMAGSFIEGDVHLITAEKAQLESLVEVINRAGKGVENITLNAYASAQAVLTPEDKKMGVALIDIGEGSTDLIIFKNEKLIYSKSIPLGGMHYTNDIGYILQLERHNAEELRNLCQNKRLEESISIKIDGEEKNFSVSSIRDIIDARSGDIIRYVVGAIEESGFKGYLGNGVILTGGVVMVEGVVEKLSKDLNYKVKIGMPMKIKGMPEVHPSMSTSLGILLETLENEHDRRKNKKKNEEKEENKIPEEKVSEVKASEKEKKVSEKATKKSSKKLFNIREWLSNFI
jgi:cell division protein FtsA